MKIERNKTGAKEVGMIPLINLVFLLLIFFLVAGTIEKFDLIDIELPVADSGKVLEEGHLVIVLGPGPYYEMLLDDELVGEEELQKQVKQSLKENPERIVSIKADARLEAEKMIKMMNMLKIVGAHNLSLTTQSLD